MRRDYSVGVYEKAFPETLSLNEMLKEAKQAGFDFFEINIDRTEQRISRVFDDEYIRMAKDAIRENDFAISSLGLSALGTYTLGHPDPVVVGRGMEIFRHTVIFAEKLGIRMIQIPGADMPKSDRRDESTDERFFENLKRAADFAYAHGMLLGIENMENDYMDTVEKCLKAEAAVSSPYLRLYPDSGNITNAFSNNMPAIISDLSKARGHALAFHFKEVTPVRYGGLFYGDGWVDFPSIAREAYGIGIKRFTMEYWYTGNPQWRDDLKKARNLCDIWLNQK